jgi:hypothetical protein
MILHPAGLEGGILAIVAEDQQALSLGVVHHVLRQDVDIGHVGARAQDARARGRWLPMRRPVVLHDRQLVR